MSENKTNNFDIEVHFSMDSIRSFIAQEGHDEAARCLGMEIIREFYRRRGENDPIYVPFSKLKEYMADDAEKENESNI